MRLSNIFFISIFLYLGVQGQTVKLSVMNGYGSGKYYPGDTVYVFARAFPIDSIMDRWQADQDIYIEDEREWLTRIVMPDHNVIVRALWTYSKPMSIKETRVKVGTFSKKVWYAIPPKVNGVITLHHFTNGTGQLFFNRVEYLSMCQYLYDKGMLLVSYNAYEVDDDTDGLKQWRIFPLEIQNNEDHMATAAILDSLIGQGIINMNTPRFAIGMSAGGAYTPSVAYALRYKAWVNFCTKGNGQLFEILDVPGIQLPSQYDFNSGQDNDEKEALLNYQKLINRGILSKFILHSRYPLYKERFTRVKGIDRALSIRLYDELRTYDIINEKNEPIVQSDTLEYYIRNKPNILPTWSSLKEDIWKECLYQYRCAFADHELSADHNYSIYDFLLKACKVSQTDDLIEHNSVTVLHDTDGFLMIKNNDHPTNYRIIDTQGRICNKGLCIDNVSTQGLYSGLFYLQLWASDRWQNFPFVIIE